MNENRRILWSLLLLLVCATAVVYLVVQPEPADAAGCGSCEGPVITVTGIGTGSSCSMALENARINALTKAYANAPECMPCAITNGPHSCGAPSGSGFRAAWTLKHRCKACGLPSPF